MAAPLTPPSSHAPTALGGIITWLLFRRMLQLLMGTARLALLLVLHRRLSELLATSHGILTSHPL
jgi:hypothetical protein